MPVAVVLVAFSYLLGSIPSGFIVGMLSGIDVRDTGSGNIGATNVARSLGKGLGLLTLVADTAKGYLPVYVARYLEFSDAVVAAAAAAAFLGHLYPVFLRFKGGKGVATALGALLAIAPPVPAVLAIFFAGAVLVSGIVSVGSIVAAAAAPILLAVFSYPPLFIALGGFLGVMVIVRHRENIKRLRAGTEPKFRAR
jgi:glycerol-3-phosphate acyltransferase PlsY